MSWRTELQSWLSPTSVNTGDPPAVGDKAPASKLKIPAEEGKPTVVTFLRHCGCPFAEKTFLEMRSAAAQHPDIHFIAVSHSDEPATKNWLQALPDPSQNDKVEVVVDDQRTIYAAWGLGVSSFWHVLNPTSLMSVNRLGRQENIWNRPTESGNRWQTSGTFAVDGQGKVTWSKPSVSADEIPDFAQVISATTT